MEHHHMYKVNFLEADLLPGTIKIIYSRGLAGLYKPTEL